MAYGPINKLDFQNGIDASAAPLSPRSMATLDPNGTWNHIISGSGFVKPWSGGTSQGAGTGSRKMVPFGVQSGRPAPTKSENVNRSSSMPSRL